MPMRRFGAQSESGAMLCDAVRAERDATRDYFSRTLRRDVYWSLLSAGEWNSNTAANACRALFCSLHLIPDQAGARIHSHCSVFGSLLRGNALRSDRRTFNGHDRFFLYSMYNLNGTGINNGTGVSCVTSSRINAPSLRRILTGNCRPFEMFLIRQLTVKVCNCQSCRNFRYCY